MSARPSAAYPALVWTLVRTDFKSRYHGTFGGYLWALLKPMTMFVVLLGVFSMVFTMEADYNLNLIIGLFLWDFFAEGTRSGLMSLHAKSFLITKARFPTWVVVVTSCSNALITLVLFSVVVTLYIGLFDHPLAVVQVLLFASYLLAFLVIVLGISLATSALFLRFRDLNQVWDMVLQAGFFVAPVIYPLGIIPERFHRWLYLWLPTPVIQFSRAVLVRGEVPSGAGHALLWAAAAGVLGVGAVVYARVAPRAVEAL